MDTYTITWTDAHGYYNHTNRDGAAALGAYITALATTPGCDLVNVQKN